MYYSSQPIRTPKNKIPAKVVTADGNKIEGCLFLTGDRRISDLLNGDVAYLPIETIDGEIHILNRHMISHVMPREVTEERTDKSENNVMLRENVLKLPVLCQSAPLWQRAAQSTHNFASYRVQGQSPASASIRHRSEPTS